MNHFWNNRNRERHLSCGIDGDRAGYGLSQHQARMPVLETGGQGLLRFVNKTANENMKKCEEQGSP
jgi:hypothetical protein